MICEYAERRLPGDEKERGQQEKTLQVEGKKTCKGVGRRSGGSGKSKAVCQELNLIQHSWGLTIRKRQEKGLESIKDKQTTTATAG